MGPGSLSFRRPSPLPVPPAVTPVLSTVVPPWRDRTVSHATAALAGTSAGAPLDTREGRAKGPGPRTLDAAPHLRAECSS